MILTSHFTIVRASTDKSSSTIPGLTPTVSEDGSTDEGVTVHQDAPAVVHGGSAPSPSARKS